MHQNVYYNFSLHVMRIFIFSDAVPDICFYKIKISMLLILMGISLVNVLYEVINEIVINFYRHFAVERFTKEREEKQADFNLKEYFIKVESFKIFFNRGCYFNNVYNDFTLGRCFCSTIFNCLFTRAPIVLHVEK